MSICGGLTEVKDATPEIQTMCDGVKADVEEKAGKEYEIYTAKKYKSQIVSGTNYFIKVHVGGDDYIHITINKHGYRMRLVGVQTNKTESDEIVYI
ncbi:cystatin-B-like [Clupea harengus]|uniref:Cystatin-B n=1 Tax=Clupea harengus TaxID=7950 RepID=A0A6P8ETK5_CLUHA|nr:cystatin-B-like [Clupea harengus]